MHYTVHVGSEVREIELEAGNAPGTFVVKMGGRTLPVAVRTTADGSLVLDIEGRSTEAYVVRARGAAATVCTGGQALEVTCRTAMEEELARSAEAAGEKVELQVRSNMPGKIVEIKVAPGDVVAAGQTLVILEAMKMENAIQSKGAARVKHIAVKPGQAVDSGALLVELEHGEAK